MTSSKSASPPLAASRFSRAGNGISARKRSEGAPPAFYPDATARKVFLLVTAAWLWTVPSLAQAQQAGSVDPSFGASLGLAGHVQKVAVQPDGKVIVAGNFKRGIVRLNADGTDDAAFDQGDGATGGLSGVTAIGLQPDGKIVVGGDFSAFNGATRHRIARLNADGGIDASFNPSAGTDDFVDLLILQPDGKIVVGGLFDQFNSTVRHGIARLNADGSLDTSFDPGSGAKKAAQAIALQPDGKIVIGYFSSADGYALTRLNADGSPDASFTAVDKADNEITAVAVQSDGKMIVSGYFLKLNGADHAGIARFNADGSLDTDFNPTRLADGSALALALQPDGKIIVGGDFSISRAAGNGLARLLSDGSLDAGFDPGTGTGEFDTIYSVALQSDGRIVVGGDFTTFNGFARNGVARISSVGTLDEAFQADVTRGLNGAVQALAAQADGKIIAAGVFTTFNGAIHNALARFNAGGTLDMAFAPPTVSGDSANAVTVQPDGKIIAGGLFEGLDHVGRDGVVRLNSDGSLDSTFVHGADLFGYVTGITLQSDGKMIVVGGSFTCAELQSPIVIVSRNCIARLNADGSLDTSFDPGAGPSGSLSFNFIEAAAVQADGKILVFGNFNSFNGVPRNGVARLNADGSLDQSFDPGANISEYGSVRALAPQPDGQLVVVGDFTTFGGVVHNHIARLRVDGSVDAAFTIQASANGTVSAVALPPDGKLFLGGTFNAVDGVVANYLVRLDSAGFVDPAFDSGGAVTGIQALVLQPDDGKVLTGGDFAVVDGTPINALARLNSDGSLDASFAPGFGVGDTVQAIALQPDDGDVLIAATVVVDSDSTSAISAIGPQTPGHPHTQAKVQNKIHRASKANGKFDPAFGAVTNGTTLQVVGLPGGQVLISGAFGQVNGFACSNLARLDQNGGTDTSFAGGADGTVRVLVVQKATGAVYVGGDFSNVDGIARNHLARLGADGGMDTGFDPGAGPNGTVNALKALANGQVLIGGSFTRVGTVARGGLARLNADGSLDLTFNPGAVGRASAHRGSSSRRPAVEGEADAPGTVMSIDVQADDKVIIGGLFDALQNVARHNVLRVLVDGTLDTSFDPGAGPNAAVNVLQLQPDRRTLLGGAFSSVGGLERQGAARLLGDPATVTVGAPVTQIAAQPGKKAKVIFTRTGGDLTSALTINYKAAGTAQAGVDYKALKGSVTILAGQTTAAIKVKFLDAGPDVAAKRKLKIKLATGDGYTLVPGGAKAQLVLLPPP